MESPRLAMYAYLHPEKIEKIMEELRAQKVAMSFLEAIRIHHKDTHDHSIRVAKLSIDLALENGLSEKTIRIIGCAALLHDYGKSKIDAIILSKSGALTRLETLIISRHSHVGAQELKRVLPKATRKIIDSHHRPSNTLAQIVSAADMYDALISPRAYKDAFEIERVIEIMMKQFAGKPALIHQLVRRRRMA